MINGGVTGPVSNFGNNNTGVIGDGNEIHIGKVVVNSKSTQKEKISKWLKPPDPSRNLHAASEKHAKHTGTWLIKGKHYKNWISAAGFMWLYGRAGCGKTILSSLVIADVKDRCANDNGWAYAYFYFDARDSQTALQFFRSFLLSLVVQLLSQGITLPDSLVKLFEADRQPSLSELQGLFLQLFKQFKNVYIIIDALDECTNREKLIEWIITMVNDSHGGLHLLATSRPEPDIKNPILKLSSRVALAVNENDITDDMHMYIDQVVQAKWPQWRRDEIRRMLLGSGETSFWLLDFQLQDLQKCTSLADAKKRLRTLPKSLGDAYEEILTHIKADFSQTRVLLSWLAFSVEPLKLKEIAEIGIADLPGINATGLKSFDEDGRLVDKFILGDCSGLVTVQDGYVKLSHLSIKEHIFFPHSKSKFKISEADAHLAISQICLLYLMYCAQPLIFNPSQSVNQEDSHKADSEVRLQSRTRQSFPLLPYAARQWDYHAYFAGGDQNSGLEGLLVMFFNYECPAFLKWRSFLEIFWEDFEAINPLYYTSKLGFEVVTRKLLANGAAVNVQEGECGHPLQAAAAGGHVEIVRMLLRQGAMVNAKAGRYGSALHAAAASGHFKVVRLLLESGANVNLTAGIFFNPLSAAAARGHLSIVQLLINNKADLHAKGWVPWHNTALQTAAFMGRTEVVRLLLDEVLARDVNKAVEYGRALEIAAHQGHNKLVEMLVEKGAVEAKGGHYNLNALMLAGIRGHTEIFRRLVKRVLEGGVNRNLTYGRVLKMAVSNESVRSVQILLDIRREIDVQGGRDNTALTAATISEAEIYIQGVGALDSQKHGALAIPHQSEFDGVSILLFADPVWTRLSHTFLDRLKAEDGRVGRRVGERTRVHGSGGNLVIISSSFSYPISPFGSTFPGLDGEWALSAQKYHENKESDSDDSDNEGTSRDQGSNEEDEGTERSEDEAGSEGGEESDEEDEWDEGLSN